MNAVFNLVGHLPAVAVYAVVAMAVLAESVLLVGAVIAVAAGAVVTGDFLAHRTGRFLADRLRTGRAGRRIPPALWARAETLMGRHGGRAVFRNRSGAGTPEFQACVLPSAARDGDSGVRDRPRELSEPCGPCRSIRGRAARRESSTARPVRSTDGVPAPWATARRLRDLTGRRSIRWRRPIVG